MYRDIIAEQTLDGPDVDNGASELIRGVSATLIAMREQQEEAPNATQVQQPVQGGGIGRPRFNISREQMSYLIDNRFTAPQIADMLGVSVRTVRRRMSFPYQYY